MCSSFGDEPRISNAAISLKTTRYAVFSRAKEGSEGTWVPQNVSLALYLPPLGFGLKNGYGRTAA